MSPCPRIPSADLKVAERLPPINTAALTTVQRWRRGCKVSPHSLTNQQLSSVEQFRQTKSPGGSGRTKCRVRGRLVDGGGCGGSMLWRGCARIAAWGAGGFQPPFSHPP